MYIERTCIDLTTKAKTEHSSFLAQKKKKLTPDDAHTG
jgi:hypothetical protein